MVITSFLTVSFSGLLHWEDCQRRVPFFRELILDGVVGLVPDGAASEVLNVSIFLECTSPTGFSGGPGFFGIWAVVPFFPCVGEFATLDGMLGPSGDHGGLGDWYPCICGKILAVLLFSGVYRERKRRINTLEEGFHVSVDLTLIDVTIAVADVIKKVTDKHIVESFVRVVKLGVINRFDGLGESINGNAAHMLAGLPVA